MSGRTTEMGYLIKFKPEEAKAKILGAIRAAKANKGGALAILGCTYSTLYRWFGELDMKGEVDALVAKAVAEGWAEVPKGGRPPGSLNREPRKARAAKPTKMTTARPTPKKKRRAAARA